MVQRWGRAEIFRGVSVAAVVSVVLIIAALVDRGFARFVDASNGPALVVPPAEPDNRIDIAEIDLSGKSPEEIAALLDEWSDSQSADDFTRSFDITATVNADHSVTITEDIVQVFRTQRRGIERYIPLETNEGTSLMRSVGISTSSGTPDDVHVSDIDSGVNVRIGNPDRYITGTHAYRLTYVLEDVIDLDGASTLIRLDAINAWRQEIRNLSYRVRGPAAPVGADCFVGYFGSTERCATVELTADGARFAPGRALAAGEGVTVELRYPTDAVSGRAVVTSRRGPLLQAVIVSILMFVVVAIGYVITLVRERRSIGQLAASVSLTFEGLSQESLSNRVVRGSSLPPPRSAPVQLGDSDSPPPLPADTAIGAPVEFVPPLALDPASMLRLRDLGRVDIPALLAATLVDLAADGVISLERGADGDTWVLHRIAQAPRGVTAYEETLLRALLDDSDSCVLGERATEVGKVIPGFVGEIDANLRRLDLIGNAHIGFSATGKVGAVANAITAVVFFVIASLVFIGVLSQASSPVAVGTTFAAITAAIVLGTAFLRDRRRQHKYSRRGLGALHRITGFERFFDDSEAIHARAAGNLGVFREYMGYAVAFGHVDTWVGAMPEQVASSLVGTVRMSEFGALAAHSAWRSASHSYAASTRSKSSASFGGGGFSGGGFSGGGRGGGGGGSW